MTKQTYNREEAEKAYGGFLKALGFNWRDNPHMKDTPKRVTKAWIEDLAKGCFEDTPKITSFENDGSYDGIVCQTNIPVVSMCAHHNLPFFGYCHVAYIPEKDGRVVGLSKLNRVVDHFSRRPQVQETLTMEIHNFINNLCEHNKGVSVLVEANHTCCSLRGIKQNSTMRTAKMSGAFIDPQNNSRNEFYKFVEFAQSSRSLV
jgi:GTP cyclohydrolase I